MKIIIAIMLFTISANAVSANSAWRAMNNYELRELKRNIYFLNLELKTQPNDNRKKNKLIRYEQRKKQLLLKK